MILKGSQRRGGANLAVHLMRTDENEHVRVHELRGFVAEDLRGAFKEAEAVSRGTKCRQYLFSLSLSPPEAARVSVADFAAAIDRIEDRLGLQGQPRAIVFHEKEGRRHAHCVWSRIDAASMTARPLSFFKNRLMEVSRDLYLDHGWQLPGGIAIKGDRNPTNFTLAEWQQAKRQGMDPRWTKEAVQACWAQSDNARAFARSLEARGFFLAKGDKRGFVVLDYLGEVHSLPRVLGLKTKEVRARLGDGAGLKSVEETKAEIGARMRPAIRRHIEESRERFARRSATLGAVKEEMTRAHRKARVDLDARLEAEWLAGARERAARLPKGLAGLWHRITGKYREMKAQAEREAVELRWQQDEARQRLIDRQRADRAGIQAEFKELRKDQADRLRDLRADVGRFLKFSRGHGAEVSAQRGVESGLGLQR
ncbi:relaxase/mobilization nuclease domain-containing protein [Siccirubricoccus phaeus]|uniref:relaxase/mobilization nuclease domain-containing protein n=1 Tax=Siccirubricoccus phaeus TaxID=2595053 RepID=UPI0011F2CB4A|nr:relaxase [Siccirubricoccus phaeus]